MTEEPAASSLVPTRIGPDGTVRKTYYGEGEQPWDTLCRRGWGAAFSGGNVLKYLRRQKNSDDLDKARWYWLELQKLANVNDHSPERVHAAMVLTNLVEELSNEEIRRLISLTLFPAGSFDPAYQE